MVVEEDFDHADQPGVQFITLEHFGQLRRSGIDDFLLQPARERNGVEVADGPDAEGGERMIEVALALQICGAPLALEAVGRFLRRFGWGHTELGNIVGGSHYAVARLFSSTFERWSLGSAATGTRPSHTLMGS